MEKKNDIDWTSLSIALVLFVLTRPYFFWGLLSNTYIKLGFNTIIGVLLYRQLKKLTSADIKLILLYELTFLLFIILQLIHGSNVFGIIGDLPICLFVCACLMNQNSMQKVGDYLFNIVIVISSIGFVFFILSILGFSMPSLGTIDHYAQERSYTIYPLYLIEDRNYTGLFRFCGVYDEAGVLGTIFPFFYVVKKGNYKDWRVWACLIIGIFTFSMFFYSVLLIYWVVQLFSLKTKKITIVFSFILFGGFFVLTKNNPEMRIIIWDRFEWDSQTNTFVGDNRMNESAEMAYRKLQGTSDYWWGLSRSNRGFFLSYYEGSASYKGVVAYNGMVFFALYVLFFAMLGWKYKSSNIDYILYLLIVALCLYQRTNIYGVAYMFIYGLIARSKLPDDFIEKKLVKNVK